jgi:hypothetical protein
MNKGCLIFAHNGDIDYGSQAVLSASLVNKHLNVPVTLVSDDETVTYLKNKFTSLPFNNIIIIEKPITDNKRQLHNGIDFKETISFINSNRNTAWSITPYDRTLVIDADFLIFSDQLNKYWDLNDSFLISPGMLDPTTSNITNHWVSPNSIRMLWATSFMFTKNQETKIFFDLMQHIQEEYKYYSIIYDFDCTRYRNDYVFSIACHIMSDFGQYQWHGELPSPILIRDVDLIQSVRNDGVLALLQNYTGSDDISLFRTKNQDVHLMNKRALIDNLPLLLEVACD